MESLFNNVAGLGNFITKCLQRRCFLLNMAKFLKTPILKNICCFRIPSRGLTRIPRNHLRWRLCNNRERLLAFSFCSWTHRLRFLLGSYHQWILSVVLDTHFNSHWSQDMTLFKINLRILEDKGTAERDSDSFKKIIFDFAGGCVLNW